MAPKNAAAPQAVKGPPKELIARIKHLRNLLKNLPDSLPENPSDSRYQFYLDKESLDMRSHFGAAGHALELSFDTCNLGGRPIEFHQSEQESFRKAWIERLIDATVRSGAKIPAKRYRSVLLLKLATLRKRRQRERYQAAVGWDTDVADLSRPATQGWKKHRNGMQGSVVQNVPSQRVFWFHSFLWNLIEAALRRAGWSSAQAVTALQRSHPHLFDSDTSRLHCGTLHKWIVNGERRFTDAALQNISNCRSLVGTGRAGILAAHPEIVASIVETLTGVQIARALMIALIQKARPELLEKFKCSEKFV
ncbi:hypothetical protein K438DRAFT_1983003 [Mycena galopus ATCC 62051]|nr:hypothetical protein K438DRAFT_1983003 [Mycena galopus ATCC 62051]